MDWRLLDGRQLDEQRCWTGDSWTNIAAGQETEVDTARRETVLLDSKQLDWRLLDRQLEWRLLDGRQIDSVAGQETAGQLEWRMLDGRQLDRRQLDW